MDASYANGLVVVATSTNVQVFDASGAEKASFEAKQEGVLSPRGTQGGSGYEPHSCAISPDGKTVVIGALENGKKNLKKKSVALLFYAAHVFRRHPPHRRLFLAPLILLDFVVVGHKAGHVVHRVFVYDFTGSALQEKKVLEKHNGGVTCANYSPDGKYLATADAHNNIYIWDAATFECIISTW